MMHILLSRWRQGHRTLPYPKEVPTLPMRFRGLPSIQAEKCPEGCRVCVDVCPTEAIRLEARGPQVNLGRCLFCPDCSDACPEGAIKYTQDHCLAANSPENLIVTRARRIGGPKPWAPNSCGCWAVPSNCAS